MWVEKKIEGLLFGSRFILVPFYLGLIVGILVALMKFGQEVFHLLLHGAAMGEEDVVLGILKLVDMTLLANLLLMVGMAGYENFVSKLVPDHHKDRPSWLDEVDFSSMKLKMLGSIVAISAIQLLADFMATETHSEKAMLWRVIIHVTITVSAVLLALADKIAHGDDHDAQSSAKLHGTEPPDATDHAQPPALPHQDVPQKVA